MYLDSLQILQNSAAVGFVEFFVAVLHDGYSHDATLYFLLCLVDGYHGIDMGKLAAPPCCVLGPQDVLA